MGINAVAPPSRTANKSRVIVARITFLLNTNRSPAMRIFQVLVSFWSLFSVVRRISRTRRKNANAQPAPSRYTNENPTYATKNPLRAGPTTDPIWKTLLFQVTAFANASRGTRVGKNELRAAQLNVRTAAPMKRSRSDASSK